MRETTSFYKGWHLYSTEAWRHGVRIRARNNDELRAIIDLRPGMTTPLSSANLAGVR